MARKDHQHELTRRERQIMDILFRLGKATVADVMRELPDPLSRTAVGRFLAIEDSGKVDVGGFLIIRTANGVDVVTLAATTVNGGTEIYTGADADLVQLTYNTFGWLYADGGAGTDRFYDWHWNTYHGFAGLSDFETALSIRYYFQSWNYSFQFYVFAWSPNLRPTGSWI